MSVLRAVPILLLAAPVAAQVSITLLDSVPPGLRVLRQGTLTLEYSLQGTPNGVQVDFFRDDGLGQVTVAIPDPTNPPPPFRVTLPLKTNVDRAPNVFQAVARDTVTNQISLGGPFTVVSDDVGPDPPEITSPVFPLTTFSSALRIDGTALNSAGGTPATLPETAGQIVVRLAGTPTVLGGAAIRADSRFSALANLTGLTPGVTADLEILAVDEAGNPGTPLVVQVTCAVAAAPAVTAALEPPDGTITRNPGVSIRGEVTGEGGLMTLHFFVDGKLSGQITGVASGTPFRHTLSLPGEGTHALSIQATFAGQLPDARVAQPLGVVTLDRSP